MLQTLMNVLTCRRLTEFECTSPGWTSVDRTTSRNASDDTRLAAGEWTPADETANITYL